MSSRKKKLPNRTATRKTAAIEHDEDRQARAQFAAMSLAMRQAYNFLTEGCEPEYLLEVAATYRVIADG